MYTNTAMAARDSAAAEMVKAPRVVCISSPSDSFSFSSCRQARRHDVHI